MLDGLEELGEEEDRPNIPKLISTATPFTTEKPRRRNSPSGSIGCADRRSTAEKAPSATTPRASSASTSTLVQPTAPPRTSPKTTPNSPLPSRRRPRRTAAGRRGLREAVPGEWDERDPDRHVDPDRLPASPSTTAPPTRGPTATASPPTPPAARATLRRAAGTPAERRVKESGTMSAPPAPWRARALRGRRCSARGPPRPTKR